MRSLIHERASFSSLKPNDRVLVGDKHYIVERVAKGGMGCVLLLRLDTTLTPRTIDVLTTKIALKGVLPRAADSAGLALFRRELTIWSGFQHYNIVSLLEILDGGHEGWIAAMDSYPGSLRDLLNKSGKFSIEDSTSIICNLLDGLAHAYEQDKVLHLDLKPENVLYTLDLELAFDSVKEGYHSLKAQRFMISDWGIASIKQTRLDPIADLPLTDPTAQRTFNNMGTLFYMAPERFKKGTPSTVASDVFSLGMIYLEMLVGRLPFRKEVHPVQSLLSRQYLDDSMVLTRAAQVPASIERQILNMIAFFPSDRPTNYPALRASLAKGLRRATGIFTRLFR